MKKDFPKLGGYSFLFGERLWSLVKVVKAKR